MQLGRTGMAPWSPDPGMWSLAEMAQGPSTCDPGIQNQAEVAQHPGALSFVHGAWQRQHGILGPLSKHAELGWGSTGPQGPDPRTWDWVVATRDPGLQSQHRPVGVEGRLQGPSPGMQGQMEAVHVPIATVHHARLGEVVWSRSGTVGLILRCGV